MTHTWRGTNLPVSSDSGRFVAPNALVAYGFKRRRGDRRSDNVR